MRALSLDQVPQSVTYLIEGQLADTLPPDFRSTRWPRGRLSQARWRVRWPEKNIRFYIRVIRSDEGSMLELFAQGQRLEHSTRLSVPINELPWDEAWISDSLSWCLERWLPAA